jgi:hypothetical protein
MKNRKFKVEIYTDVYVDSYEEGEGERVNYYTNETEVISTSPFEAIEKALYKLGFEFKKEHSQLDEEENICYYSNLCDNDNFEINEKDSYYKEWKEGKRILYSNNHTIKVYEVNNVLIN